MIAAEWKVDDQLPTILIYGHADVQPAKASEWNIESPFGAEVHTDENGELRLYGRGTSDDIGGWYSHVVAIRAWLATYGRLPLNVRLLIEFEEEIGSPNLMAHIDQLGDFCDVDAMMLTDCENPSTSTPGLTVSLRGLAIVDVVCTAHHPPGHSGLYGNIWSNPSCALILVLHRLLDADGRARFARVSLTDDESKKLAHLDGGEYALPPRNRSHAEWAWRQLAIDVQGTSLPDISIDKRTLEFVRDAGGPIEIPEIAHSIPSRASARLEIRVPPGLTNTEVLGELEKVVSASPPPGIQVAVDCSLNPGVESWLYDVPDCAAFQAVELAYERVWGKRPERVGVGGSIPFVKQFGDRYGQTTPLILNGVLDPASALHAPNESLHLGVFRKAIHTNIRLLDALGKLRKGEFLAPPE